MGYFLQNEVAPKAAPAKQTPDRQAFARYFWKSQEFAESPFGEVVAQSGSMAAINPFKFSTKYQDDESGLLYYGYRYYDPVTGRWPSRDPIGEDGGENLYNYTINNPINQIDVLGLAAPYSRVWPKTCNGIGDATWLLENVRKLGSDFNNAKQWKGIYNNPYQGKGNKYPYSAAVARREEALSHWRGYLQQAAQGCQNARRVLELIKNCCGPWTPEQEAAFDAVKNIISQKCDNFPPDPPAQPESLPEPSTSESSEQGKFHFTPVLS